jgi:hypothetical protein
MKKAYIISMKTQHFFTNEVCKTSINITPFHFEYLIYLTETRFNGNLSLTIDYLLKKYLTYLYRISIAPTKRTLTATYQPRTKNYVIKKIRIQPTYWGKLYELRFLLGFSVSFIIRIMLDWEMQEEQIPVETIFIRPALSLEDEGIHVHIQIGNNYSSYNRLSHANFEVYSEFSCPAA